jgi:beta-N-acetylhexosaminidase
MSHRPRRARFAFPALAAPPRLTRRAFLRQAAATCAAALLAGCAVPPPAPEQVPADTPTTPTPAAMPAEASLRSKIGQLLVVGFRGLTLHEGQQGEHHIVRDIRDYNLGGVLLFDRDVRMQTLRNIQSPQQLGALAASLQAIADVPLLIAVDHEGGQVTRLKPDYGFQQTVSHGFLGATNNLRTTYEYAIGMARALADVGVNLNLAPVVDLDANPQNPVIGRYERSFSSSPRIVTDHALAFIKAHHEHGVLCTLKHFPGHGSSSADSHAGPVDVTATWTRRELQPYRHIIELQHADLIMTAHVINSALDPQHPATLSAATLGGLLRGELGYQGVVLSDDLQMQAISAHYAPDEALARAIEAGVDLLMLANNGLHDPEIVPKTIDTIARLVQEGRVSTARIDESYARLRVLKGRLLAR